MIPYEVTFIEPLKPPRTSFIQLCLGIYLNNVIMIEITRFIMFIVSCFNSVPAKLVCKFSLIFSRIVS